MWFNKHHPDTLCIDNRQCGVGFMADKYPDTVNFGVQPDIVMDFKHMNFPDESFYLVVFDPPHLTRNTSKSYMACRYGSLDKTNWRYDIQQGFRECWRVLKPNGTLIFKWSEHDIPLKAVLAAIGHQPLFGHRSGKQSRTHWLCFFKGEQ